MSFKVEPSDQVVIDSDQTTRDDFLCVRLEDDSKIYLRHSTERYPHLTIDRDFVPAAVATLARQAAKSWLQHRPGGEQARLLKSAFEARDNRSQRLLEFIAYALLDTVRVQGSSSPEIGQAWQVRDSDFNIGRHPWIIFGRELNFPGIEKSVACDSSRRTFELILPSPISKIEPIDRWDVEIRWALR